MRNALYILCACVFAVFLLCGFAVSKNWEVIKGRHFLVYYLEDNKFAAEVLEKAEGYYDKIASDLGYSRYDKFWQWENRVKIYIYLTRDEFIQATGRREWVGGIAKYKEKEIISYRWSEGFLDSLLPHELTHLIFRDFVGFKGEIPLWLDEGIAQWEEKPRKKEAVEAVKKSFREESFIPLVELTRMEVKHEKDFELVRKFYAQSVTLVGYLIEKYGGVKFSLFCRQLRDKKSIDEALSFVYTNSIRNVSELEKKWRQYYEGR